MVDVPAIPLHVAPNEIPRGRPKSGRLWKTVRTARHSDMKKDKPLRTSWKKKMEERARLKNIKLYESQIKEAKIQEKELKRKRQEDHKKQRLENERKSEVVQTIKNSAKIKRMKKKQLRAIEKR